MLFRWPVPKNILAILTEGVMLRLPVIMNHRSALEGCVLREGGLGPNSISMW